MATAIEEMARKEKCVFINPGAHLLVKDGPLDESLFIDGLHPNDKGYALIAPEIIR